MKIIEVIDYNPNWPNAFEIEKLHLIEILGSLSPDIHHIGSTSVPGLSAKPIIDILIEVDSVSSLDSFNSQLSQIGYIAKGEYGIPGRRFFEKGGDSRSHHIHAFQKGSSEAVRHLAFKEYLFNHSQVAVEYSILKKQIAQSCNNDIDKYCADKNDFIQYYEKLAIEWYALNKAM